MVLLKNSFKKIGLSLAAVLGIMAADDANSNVETSNVFKPQVYSGISYKKDGVIVKGVDITRSKYQGNTIKFTEPKRVQTNSQVLGKNNVASELNKIIIPYNPKLSESKKSNSDSVVNSSDSLRTIEYVVKPGDNLIEIAKKYDVNWLDIARKNRILADENYTIYPEQILKFQANNNNNNLESKITLSLTKKEDNFSNIKSYYDKIESWINNIYLENNSKNNEYQSNIDDDNDLDEPRGKGVDVGKDLDKIGCNFPVKFNFKKNSSINEIAKVSNLTLSELKEQLGISNFNRLQPGKYEVCVKADKNTGYIPFHADYNKKHLLTKTGDVIWKERKLLGVYGLGNFLDVKPGDCFPSADERRALIHKKYSIFEEVAKKYDNVSAEVLAAVMKIESGGNSMCISPTGALGSMGLTKHYYHDTKSEPINPFNDKEAISRAAQRLSGLLKKYNGSYHLALSAYNQGEAMVDIALAFAKTKGVKNSYDIVNSYLPTSEGRNYSRLVLNQENTIRKERKNLERLVIANVFNNG